MLGITGKKVLARQDGIEYKGTICSYKQEFDTKSGECNELDFNHYSLDGVAYSCYENATMIEAWQ